MDASNGSSSAAAPQSRPLSIRTKPRAPAAGTDEWTTNDSTAEKEPVSPTARLMEPVYIVVTIGLGSPLDLPVFTTHMASGLPRYSRFQSIQVTEDGNPRWARVKVKVEDHIVVPTLDPVAVAANPDQSVEDYVASLFTLPMDRSRPLWEFHFLNFPTSEATSTAIIRVHHSLGDGMSLMTLLMSSASSAADPTRLPAMPKQPERTGAIYAPRRPRSSGAMPFLGWVCSYFVLAWNTMVDVAAFIATMMFLRDPHTLFKRSDDTVFNPPRRFVHRSLSLDDVKFIKNAINCTVNDVLVGATSAALSRYYFRKSGNSNSDKIRLRSVLPVNLRSTTSLQTNVNMIESGKSDDVAWGNQLGYIILPFHLAMHDDPLAYIRKAKKTLDRKKSSLEVVFTCKMSELFLKMFGVKAGAFIFRRMFANTTISFTSMIGPAEQTNWCGHPVVFIAPSVYGVPQALIMHYQSYGSTIKVILSVDKEIFPDYSQLLDDFAVSFRCIKDAASKL
ncbi:wax ester synthase/diacylglycerol acyltransferase 11 isoform X1 [Lolium perenne]|uniref:wax ester synthase/diacylglycerol acyltransferase 11 isoform X1 n=1 Tax=Lolium perenne TaxID=4522 RepID=UPI0021F66E9E|nr:wax ester synthase/diacylglycerol acyltransferase 11-like isoform X1 [Lolium perenne]